MEVKTRIFGTVDVDEEKIIEFPMGIVGFPDMTHFALMYDVEKEDGRGLSYLVSIEEPDFAMPVVRPVLVKEDYNPEVDDSQLLPLGEFRDEDLLVFVTMTVPHDLTKITVNLMGPIVINTVSRKGVQVVLDAPDCPVRYPVYEVLARAKAAAQADGKAVN